MTTVATTTVATTTVAMTTVAMTTGATTTAGAGHNREKKSTFDLSLASLRLGQQTIGDN